MDINNQLNFLEAKEASKNMAQMHYEYYKEMKEKCDNHYVALTLTCAFIESLNYGGE